MRRRILIALAVALGASRAQIAFPQDVAPKILRAEGADEAILSLHSVVVAPPVCSGVADCSRCAQEIALHTRTAMKLRTIDASRAEQVAFDAGLEVTDAASAAKLAEKLDSDVVILARFVSQQVTPPANGNLQIAKVAAQLDMIDRSGKVLVRGTFNGNGMEPGESFMRACRGIMRAAFPKRKEDKHR